MVPKIRVRIPHSLIGVKASQTLRRLCFGKASRSQAKSFVHGRVLGVGVGLAWRGFGAAPSGRPIGSQCWRNRMSKCMLSFDVGEWKNHIVGCGSAAAVGPLACRGRDYGRAG